MKAKEKLVVAFSGGRTSAYMGKYLIDNFSDKYEFLFVFANTGQEHDNTLEFVKQCDEAFGFNTVWLEAVVYHNERKSNGYKIVNFETASRNGEPFEEVIKKHGVPNMAFPICTRELKLAPIDNYLKDVGFKKSVRAIGIRADEMRRVRKDATEAKIIYPLVEANVDKEDVLSWWKTQAFDLKIQEHQGNCKWCWKKSLKKHFINLRDNPEWYDFPQKMEETYPYVGAEFRKETPSKTARVFFRGYTSTKALKSQYELALGSLFPISDETNSCSESCEMFDTEFITEN